ncbi:hypothetical protein JHK87_006275 [Glycine soja]|nr:hypothetical protein JHK87_006275 [Glycine soja]
MRILVCRFVNYLNPSVSFREPLGSLRRACNTSLKPFSDEELAKKIEDLTLKFQLSIENTNANDLDSEDFQEISLSSVNFAEEFELPEEIILANIERKANNVELPFSLRIMKNKL